MGELARESYPVLLVGMCPKHGPFVAGIEGEGREPADCPEIVDYDGVTCHEPGTPLMRYVATDGCDRDA